MGCCGGKAAKGPTRSNDVDNAVVNLSTRQPKQAIPEQEAKRIVAKNV
jgi:hypothetical protein